MFTIQTKSPAFSQELNGQCYDLMNSNHLRSTTSQSYRLYDGVS